LFEVQPSDAETSLELAAAARAAAGEAFGSSAVAVHTLLQD
jgi:hypothetical protein